MADGHGGPRTPAKPAHVSGPGQYSKRTDGHPAQVLSAAPDQGYGDATQQMNDQRVAPLGAAAPMPPAAQPQDQQPAAHQMPAFSGAPLSAPTNRPGEPVTTGVPIGPGAGPEAMPAAAQPAVGMGQATGAMTNMLAQIAPTDASGVVAALLQRAQTLGV